MKITKANWSADGSRLTLSVPFAKVNQETRTVSGFATLDNVDLQGDIVDTQASLDAFKEFRGNIREMHQPIAAGKLVSFAQEEFYDPTDKKVYSGVFVTAYVSKGAQDTWEKVLDGTLSGFSIGGEITLSEPVLDKSLGRTVRVIKAYNLIELSLVDSPANQLANIFSVVKTDQGLVYKGMAVDTKTETIMWCDDCKVAAASESDSKTCDICGKQMQNIGWIEASDSANKADSIRQVVDSYLGTLDVPEIAKQADNDISEGGIEVAEAAVDTETVEVEVEKVAVVEETSVEPVEEVVEKAAEVSEVEGTDEPDFAKALDDLKTFVADQIAGIAPTEQLAALNESIDNVTKAMEARAVELDERVSSLSKTVDSLVEQLGNVEKSVTTLDKKSAMKKSEELGGSSELPQGNTSKVWNGTFLGVETL